MKLWEWHDAFLDIPNPFIKLRVGTTKNRKVDQVSIHPELRTELDCDTKAISAFKKKVGDEKKALK